MYTSSIIIITAVAIIALVLIYFRVQKFVVFYKQAMQNQAMQKKLPLGTHDGGPRKRGGPVVGDKGKLANNQTVKSG